MKKVTDAILGFIVYTTTIGLLIFIQALHTSYHHRMDADPDGYCVQGSQDKQVGTDNKCYK